MHMGIGAILLMAHMLLRIVAFFGVLMMASPAAYEEAKAMFMKKPAAVRRCRRAVVAIRRRAAAIRRKVVAILRKAVVAIRRKVAVATRSRVAAAGNKPAGGS